MLVLLIPIFDTTLVTRVAHAVGPLGRRRAAAITRRTGWSRSACPSAGRSRVLWLLAAIGGAIGVALDYVEPELGGAGRRSSFLVGMVLFAVYLAGIRVYDETDERVQRARGFTPIVVDFMYKRRVAEVLLDFCLVDDLLLRRLPAALRRSEDFMKNFAIFTRSLPVVLGGADGGVLRRRRLSRRLAPLRHDGHAGRRARACSSAPSARSSSSSTSTASSATRGPCSPSTRVLLLLAVTLSRASFRLVGEFIQRQRQSGPPRRRSTAPATAARW